MFRKLVYIKRRAALGDVIHAEPIVSFYLSKGFRVHFISKYAHILAERNNLRLKTKFALTDRLFILMSNLLGLRFVKVVSLDNTYESKPYLSIQEAYCLEADIPFKLRIPEHISFRRTAIPKFYDPSKTVLFHVQSESNTKPYRSIFGVEWELVEEYFVGKGLECVELIDERLDYEPIFCKYIKHSRYDLFSLLENVKYFVGKDSGPAHVAISLKIESFLFYGSVDPLKRIPVVDLNSFKGVIFQNNCEFAGCYHSVTGTDGVDCRFENEPTPPCCTFETKNLIRSVSKYMSSEH